jgi:hypothetical protein
MQISIWNMNAMGLGVVTTLAIVLPTSAAVLATHLALFEARACTGFAHLKEGSSEYEQRLVHCIREGRNLPVK